MSDELETFLTDEAATEETPAEDSATEETPQTEEPQAAESTGDKDAEATAEDVPPTPEKTEKQSDNVPISALLDEREKRQQYQQQLKDTQAQLQQMQQPREAPDLLDDQGGFVNHIQQQVDNQIRSSAIQMSQEMMRSQHEDYEQVESKFLEMATANPELGAQMSNHPMPAKFVYDTVKNAEQYADMQNVPAYKAKLKAEARAEVEAEIKAEAQAKADKDAKLNGALSPSLATTRAAGANNEALSIPDPLIEGGMFDR